MMNRNTDAEFCGKVPLNQTNLIQPHGILLIVDRKDFRILQASENSAIVLNKGAAELVNLSMLDLISKEQAEELNNRFTSASQEALPFLFSFSSGQHLGLIQQVPGYLVIEIEIEPRSGKPQDTFLSVYESLKYAMADLQEGTSIGETCEKAALQLKRISGFDKVMIYRFDENWNGDVIAEAMEKGMDRYMGLKFPASDIPAQAREIYKKTAYRLIPDIEYAGVRLYPVLNPVTGGFTDLTMSSLRSVAGIHLEYLRNMGVRASMSIRIIVEGKLWGLIACHHREARFPSYEMCSVFELLSQFISSQITALQRQEGILFRNSMQSPFESLLEEVYQQKDLASSIRNKKSELLQLLSADGAAMVVNGNIELYGRTPNENEVDDLMLWVQTVAENGKIYQQHALPDVFEPSEKYAEVGSGLLVLPIRPEKSIFLLAFRGEAIRKVNWGGNPSEVIRFEPGSEKYHPRQSFQQWQQTVRKSAIPWKEEELQLAERTRNFLVESALNQLYN